MSKIAIIGSGFSGISAASYLGKEGHEVHVFEKNSDVGGRARQFTTDNGYLFDMGPSWYWMPGVFEKFFNDFGFKVEDFYTLKLLDPAFDVVYARNDTLHIPANFEELCKIFESIETGSAAKLIEFLEEAEYKYKTGIENLVYKPGLSIMEFADMEVIRGMFRLQLFSSFSKHVKKYFTHPKLVALMEFPVLFLGAMPEETPALYSLMNYAGLKLGTYYPEGGFGKVISAMQKVAESTGVRFHFDSTVEKIEVLNKSANGLKVNGKRIEFDAIIAASDYHHTESALLPEEYRNYNEEYWSKKTFAPSSLIYYLGVKKKLPLNHHTLFFDESLAEHSVEIYKQPKWPAKPLFYVSCTSKSDTQVAPEGHENLFLLMPIAPGLTDNEEIREKYFHIMMDRLEAHLGTTIRDVVDFKRSYCVMDFIKDYNSYKGNAYGLANTLMQTAILKPKIRNKIIPNLYYTGQLTVPGPGVPPSIISGKVAADQLMTYLNKASHEITV
jgi:phytoene desaturase